jgi:hypothetical protein
MASAANAGVISLPFTADSSAYFVGDFNHTPLDGGIVEFERVFSNIPATRNAEFTGSQAFTYPGFDTDGNTDGTDRTVTAVSNSGQVTTITATNTISVGDIVYVSLNWTGTVAVSFNGFRVALSGTTASVVKVALIGGGTTFANGTVTELDSQPRPQKAMTTGSITDFTYYLPGVTGGITTAADVTEDTTFSILNTSTMAATNIMSETTIPAYIEYQADIDAGNYIIIASEVTRWRGNIIQKANRKIRAL